MKTLLLAMSFLLPLCARADEAPLISVAVGQAKVKKTVAAFPIYQGGADADARLRTLREITMDDLEFSGLLDFLNPVAFVEDASKAGISAGTFQMKDWTAVGAEVLIKGKGTVEGKNLNLEVHVYAVGTGKELLNKSYAAEEASQRKLAHTVSNDILFALTGRKGPFTSKIAFVSDKSGQKEIYVMDYDGHNPVAVTPRYQLAISPGWAPDGKSIVFTAITHNRKNVRNYALYTLELGKGAKPVLLSNRQGMNSGAEYSPDGKQIALTMSFPGHAQLFIMNPESPGNPRRLTNSYGLDVDPSWSPDGKHLAFVSDRPGQSMIYKIDVDGSNVQRLTYAGTNNSSPSWSPTGEKIAFAGWNDNAVDIFIMDPDGSNIERLTKSMGRNESPDFAPDGYFLAYSSDRTGKKNIFVTNIDNTVHKQITKDFGNCESPRWSINQ